MPGVCVCAGGEGGGHLGKATESSGGKGSSDREVTHPPARERSHLSLRGASGSICACVRAFPGPTAAAAVRRRALPPISKEPIRTGGVVCSPAPGLPAVR